MAKIQLRDDQTFVEGRSAEKASELLEAAAKLGLEREVYTTTGGYIVPTEILGEAEAGTEFDPSEATVEEVLEYLDGADAEETKRVLAAEAAGKARKGIIGESE
jgi:trigger factor